MAVQCSLCRTSSETPEDRFSHDAAHMVLWRAKENHLIPFLNLAQCTMNSPKYNINILLIISSHTSQATLGAKSHHQKRTGMKHAQKPLYNYILVLNPRGKVAVATDLSTESVVEVGLRINHSVHFTRVFGVIFTGREDFEVLNGKCQYFFI